MADLVYYVTLGSLIGIATIYSDLVSEIEENTRKAEARLQAIEQRLSPVEIKAENVIGEGALDIFYEIDGNRCYLNIDGQDVKQGYCLP